MSAAALSGRKRPRKPDAAGSTDLVLEYTEDRSNTSELRSKLIGLLTKRGETGLSAAEAPLALKASAEELLPILGDLLSSHRIEILKHRKADGSEEQRYRIVAEDRADRLVGLSPEEEAVLGLIEKAGNQGLWVRSIKITTKLQQTHINKIIKRLETRKLIKQVKSIAYKNRRMYMAHDIEPAKELTGGVWYSEQELDTVFINAIRSHIVKILRDLGGSGSPIQVAEQLQQSGLSTIPLKPSDVQQVMDTLMYEGWIDYDGYGKRRVRALHRLEHAEYPSRALLVSEFMKKPKSKSGAGDYIDGDDDADVEDEDDDAEADDLHRKYALLPRRPVPHVDALTTVPCGTCPVSKQCAPGGIISPETCIYYSHWLQW